MTAYLQPGDRIHITIPAEQQDKDTERFAAVITESYAAQGVEIVEWDSREGLTAPVVVAVFRPPASELDNATERHLSQPPAHCRHGLDAYRFALKSGVVPIVGKQAADRLARLMDPDQPKIKDAGEKEEQQAAPDLGPSRRAHGVPGYVIQRRPAPAQLVAVHIGRGFQGHLLEDGCPCPQEPCGLVSSDRIVADCPEHSYGAGKTIRRSHAAGPCHADTQERQELADHHHAEDLDEPA